MIRTEGNKSNFEGEGGDRKDGEAGQPGGGVDDETEGFTGLLFVPKEMKGISQKYRGTNYGGGDEKQ